MLPVVKMRSSRPTSCRRSCTCASLLVLLTLLLDVCVSEQRIKDKNDNNTLPDMPRSSDGASLDAKESSMVVRMEVQDCGSHMTCERCMMSADPQSHCGWCSASNRCTAEDECPAGILGWSRMRPGRCPMDNSFLLAILAVAILFNITLILTIGATVISITTFFLITCLCRQCQQRRQESSKQNVQSESIQLTHIITRNKESTVVGVVESTQTAAVGTMQPSVQMGAMISELQSLLKDIRDPKLQETVRATFIPRSRLRIGDMIGKGQFGRVFDGKLQLPDTEEEPVKVAVKTLRGRKRASKKVESFLQEGVMMKNFDHPHVLRLLGVSVTNQSNIPLIILPFMAAGDLHKFIRNEEKHFELSELLQLGQQVAEGMAYLALHGFIHRDLAARNCMVDENSQVKVADFGLSKDLYEKQYYLSKDRDGKLPFKWMAQESLGKSLFTTKSDVWSFGVLLWELMTRGVMPYSDVCNFELYNYLSSGHRLRQPDNCPNNVNILMNECWHTNPDDRPTFTDLVNRLELIVNPPQRNGSDESLDANSQNLLSHTEMITDDAFILQSLLKEVSDPKLRETVQDVFIPRSHLTLGDELGKGHFGYVYAGKLQSPNDTEKEPVKVAVKTLHGQTLDPEDVESVLKEGIMMKNLDHPHVLRLLGISVLNADLNPLIILPFMAAGDLHNFVRNKRKHFTWRQLSQLGQQVAEGMAYLEQCRLVHRDLAARNCMMDENFQVKVADFGLTKDIYEKQYYRQNSECRLPIKWMALESLKENLFTTKSDVWSFGVLLWELMNRGEMPYYDVDPFNMREHLTLGHRLEQPDICPQDVYILMSECWLTNPKDRPTFADLVNRLELIVHKPPTYMNSRFSVFRNRMSQNLRKCSLSVGKAVPALTQVRELQPSDWSKP